MHIAIIVAVLIGAFGGAHIENDKNVVKTEKVKVQNESANN